MQIQSRPAQASALQRFKRLGKMEMTYQGMKLRKWIEQFKCSRTAKEACLLGAIYSQQGLKRM